MHNPAKALWFIWSQRLLHYLFGSTIFWFWVYLMNIIPETRRVY